MQSQASVYTECKQNTYEPMLFLFFLFQVTATLAHVRLHNAVRASTSLILLCYVMELHYYSNSNSEKLGNMRLKHI